MNERTLFGNTPLTSPYVISTVVALEEKRLPFELELLDLSRGDQFEAEFVQHSITNRVPTLRDGRVWVSESLAIAEYLEERYPAPEFPALLPPDVEERARVRLVQGLLRSDFLPVREERPTESFLLQRAVTPLSPKAVRSMERLLRIADQLVGDGRVNLVSQFTLADADLAMMLMRLVANGDPVPDVLVTYTMRVFERPSLAKCVSLASQATG